MHFRLGLFHSCTAQWDCILANERKKTPSVYFCFSVTIYFCFVFIGMYVNNWKYVMAYGSRKLCYIFDGPEKSVHHGWYIFEWHFILAILLILMRFLSFTGVCVHISVCACQQWLRLSGKRASIEQFVSDSEDIQSRGGGPSPDLGLLNGRRRLMTCMIFSLKPPSGRLLKLRMLDNRFLEVCSNMTINQHH